jgi:uncharacterized protein
MTKGKRLIIFLATLVALGLVAFLTWSNLSRLPSTARIILLSSLIMLSLTTLCLEHFFTRPTDVLASTISVILLLTPLSGELPRFGIWYYLLLGYAYCLMLVSMTALFLLDPDKSHDARQNRCSGILKNIAVRFGKGKIVFFLLFIVTLLSYVDSQDDAFLILFAYAAVVLFIDPKSTVLAIAKDSRSTDLEVGTIFGVQSKNTFLVRLYPTHIPIHRYDCVEFTYSMDDSQKAYRGLVVDNYLLNEQQWMKVLICRTIREALEDIPKRDNYRPNHVYKLASESRPPIISRFVGTVLEQSQIQKLRFEYSQIVPISEGTLLEVDIQSQRVLYQVVQGVTDTETLEAKNESGIIVGEAIQLGLWNPEGRTFERYGWVPDMNTPVFLAGEIASPVMSDGEVEVGTVPDTNYPVTLSIDDAVTHHLAVLGVTGCGKSVFSRDLIRKVLARGTKVICVDFTQECRGKFQDLSIQPVTNSDEEKTLFVAIESLSNELAKFKNQQKSQVIEVQEKLIGNTFYKALKRFLTDTEHSIALFELPDVSNTTGILDYTKWFFKALFHIARTEKNFGQTVCIVLEEAHTVIPEWNFIGIGDRDAQSLVNSIGQIALQGRKYGVGFIVIAQRTANVSKTILTQCNSIIAFQQFDKTGTDFLSNYMGQDMVSVLPFLKPRHAVGVGKG